MEQSAKDLGAVVVLVLLAPIFLVYDGYQKIKSWQRDRFYAFQEQVLKDNKPIVVIWEGGISEDVDKVVKDKAYIPLLEIQDGDRQINVMKLTNPELGGSRRWIFFYHSPCPNWRPGPRYTEAAVRDFNYDNPAWACRVIYVFEDGPDAWKATKDKNFWGWDLEPRLLANNGPPVPHGFVVNTATCWYRIPGRTLYLPKPR